MRYSEILQEYEPVSCGDFMRQYSIGGRGYVIYSPEPGKTACVELYDFKDLSPEGLAFHVRYVPGENKALDEFGFDRSCGKDEMMSFLFGMGQDGDSTGIRTMIKDLSGSYAFPLRDIRSAKIRNAYLFDPVSLRSRLLFENDICYAAAYGDVEAGHMNISWDPLVFASLEDRGIESGPTYLLASSNPILCACMRKLARDKMSVINVYAGNKALEALLFLSSYIGEAGTEKSIKVFSGSNVTVATKGWHPVSLVKFISSVQRQFDNKMNNVYPGMERVAVYRLESIGGNSFIVFPRLDLAIDIFSHAVIREVGLDNIHYAGRIELAKT